MSKLGFAASFGLVAVLVSSQASASVIVKNTAGTLLILPAMIGESFTMPSPGGPWDDITFNFFSDVPATTPVSLGTAYLLNQEYLGTPADLSFSTPGLLGASTGVTGGMYVFPTALVLDSGTQYFVYENVESPGSGGNIIAGGNSYFSGGGDFMPEGPALNFALSGTAVPEPSSLIVLASSLSGFGFLRRWRKND